MLPTYFLKTSAAIGTVELTGLDMIATQALGQYFAMPSLRVFTIPAVFTIPQHNLTHTYHVCQLTASAKLHCVQSTSASTA